MNNTERLERAIESLQQTLPALRTPYEGLSLLRERLDYLERSTAWASINVTKLEDRGAHHLREGRQEVAFVAKSALNVAERAVELAALAEQILKMMEA